MLIFKIIFWLSLLLIFYPYLIYPFALRCLSRFFPKNKALLEYEDDWPFVSFIISAFNEEQVLDEKIRNTLSIDYPHERLEIVVISDASDDGTDEIVKQWASQDNRIKLVRQEDRKGKTAGLNLAMSGVMGELVVFSDANAMYRPNALRELVKYFADPSVGYVVGAALYNDESSSESSQSEGMYWNYELSLKQMESDYYAVVGGDGAIYSIRRKLFDDLLDDDINDFVNPLQIVAKGYRGIFNPAAICYEDTAENFNKEFRRKRRIVNRSWRAVTRNINSFSPVRHSRFLFELVSHKVIRWFTMLFVISMTVSSLLLSVANAGSIYLLALFGIFLTFLLAFTGFLIDKKQPDRKMPRLIYIPYYFFLVNIAALLGIIDNARGVKHVTWSHVRSDQKSN